MRLSTLIFAGILFLVSCLSNCSRSQKASESTTAVQGEINAPLIANTLANPEENYATYCASCHGAKMRAFVDRKWKNGNTKADLVKSIKYGIAQAGMPAYDTTFSQAEVEALAEYILVGIKERATYDPNTTTTPITYQSQYQNLQIEAVVEDIEIPWGLKVDQDGTIYFTERSGAVKIKKTDGTIVTLQNTPKVWNQGQGGMLDIALHPDFKNNKWLYLSYSKINPEDKSLCTTAVIRGKLIDDKLTEQEEVFEALPYSNKQYHFGCRMVFDEKGFLYVSVGDRGSRDENPQALDNSCGKVHRIYDDGRIPEDNPFYGKAGAIKSIWTYGNRNPQGLVYDPFTKNVWEHEHGPRGGDELNRVQAAANYGWPIASYGINYNGTTFTDITEKEEFKSPLNVWIPSIAPSGMALVNSDNYGSWKGDILTGSLRFNYISRVKMDGEKVMEEEKILQDIGRVRSIEMGADGYLYVGVENPGRIYKVSVVD